MKKFSAAVIFSGLCAVLFMFPPHTAAQVSEEAARLLGGVKIQVLNEGMTPRDFTLRLLDGGNADGGSVTLSSYKGKVVILNFWATWCPPCRKEMPSMETFYQRYKDKGLEFLAVDLGERVDAVQKFIASNGYTFPVLLDGDRKAGGLYGVVAIPTTFIIDRGGRIIGKIVGSTQWDTPQFFAAFDALVNSR
jgi:thiol-disulfide isomerase/thioredoxin